MDGVLQSLKLNSLIMREKLDYYHTLKWHDFAIPYNTLKWHDFAIPYKSVTSFPVLVNARADMVSLIEFL